MIFSSDRQRLAVLALVPVVIALVILAFESCFGGDGSDDSDQADDNPYLDKVPDFPPPPDPQPVTLPDAPDGQIPVLHSVPTDQPVAFITIDDGQKRHAEHLQLVEAAGVPMTMFLLSEVAEEAAEEDPEYFPGLIELGSTVQAHTITHPSLEGEKERVQKEEICGSIDALEELFDERPTLFRPPYGAYDDKTLEVAADCDMTAVVHWRATVDYGEIELQPGEEMVQPGDILLLHFRDDFEEDFLVALNAIADAGLTPALLEDYIAP